jgi:hypothetical protein
MAFDYSYTFYQNCIDTLIEQDKKAEQAAKR